MFSAFACVHGPPARTCGYCTAIPPGYAGLRPAYAVYCTAIPPGYADLRPAHAGIAQPFHLGTRTSGPHMRVLHSHAAWVRGPPARICGVLHSHVAWVRGPPARTCGYCTAIPPGCTGLRPARAGIAQPFRLGARTSGPHMRVLHSHSTWVRGPPARTCSIRRVAHSHCTAIPPGHADLRPAHAGIAQPFRLGTRASGPHVRYTEGNLSVSASRHHPSNGMTSRCS